MNIRTVWQSLFALLMLLFISNGPGLFAAEPFEIVTPQGKYVVIELFNLDGEFEITADYKYAVVRTANQFSVVSVSDGKPVGEPLKANESQWKIVEQELVIGKVTSWDVYSLPKLEKLRTVELPLVNQLVDKKADWGKLQALVHGWYCQGWLLNDDLTKTLASFRAPATGDWRRVEFIEPYSRKVRDTSIPVDIRLTHQKLVLQDYDVLPLIGPDKADFTGFADGGQHRFGPDWFTVQGKANPAFAGAIETQGLYVKLLGKRFGSQQFPKVHHWWPSIPMVLDKNSDVSQWRLTVLPQMLAVDSKIVISPGPADLAHGNLNRHENTLISILNSRTLDELDAGLATYLAEANAEFELVTGRKPTHIPLALTVSFVDEAMGMKSHQIVWTELTKAELITRFGQDLLKIDANAKLKAAEARNESLHYQRNEAVKAINDVNAKRIELSKKFQFNAISYAAYLGMICILGAIAGASAYIIGIWAQREQQRSASQAEPPVISSSISGVVRTVGWLLCWFACGSWTLAQEADKWQIKTEQTQFVELSSQPLMLNGRQPFYSPHSSTLVLREALPDGKAKWTCIQLPEFKQLCELDEPTGWNPNFSSFGSRFACSVNLNQLITVDLTTGQLLPRIMLRQMAKPHILFDKAIWLQSTQLLTLPQLNAVTNHSLTTNLLPPFEQPSLTVHEEEPPPPVWYLDAQHVVVNGVVYGEDFKAGSQYFGYYTWRGFNPKLETSLIRGSISPSTNDQPASIILTLGNAPLIEAIASAKVEQAEQLNLAAFRGGFYGFTTKHVFILKSAPNRSTEELVSGLQNHPLMIPPLLTFDGKRHRIRWQSQTPDKPIHLIIGMHIDYQFMDKRHEIGLAEKAREFLQNEQEMTKIVKRFKRSARVSNDATFEECVAAYKARNMWWLKPYAASMEATFTGVPIELSWKVECEPDRKEWPTSVVVDFPIAALKAFWKESPKWKTEGDSAAEVRQSLDDLAKKEQVQEFTPVEITLPPPPVFAPLPESVDLNKIQSSFSWAEPWHKWQLLLQPVAIAIQFICLMVAVRFMMVIGQPIRLVGKGLAVAGLASLAIVTFSCAFGFLLHVIAASHSTPIYLAMLKSFTVFVATQAFVFWIYKLSLVGPTSIKVIIQLIAQFLNVCMTIVFNIVFTLSGLGVG